MDALIYVTPLVVAALLLVWLTRLHQMHEQGFSMPVAGQFAPSIHTADVGISESAVSEPNGQVPSMYRTAVHRQPDTHQMLATLYDTIHDVLDYGDTRAVFTALVRHAGELLDTPHGYLYLVASDTSALVLQIATGVFDVPHEREVQWTKNLANHVWRSGIMHKEDSVTAPNLARLGLQAIVNVPIHSGSQFFGVLGVACQDGACVFSADEMRQLQSFTDIVALALANATRLASQDLVAHQRVEQQRHLAVTAEPHRLLELAETAAPAQVASLDYMNHEIRTLLTNILGTTDLLRRNNLSSEQREGLEILRISSDALLGIVDDMLDLSKFDSGHISIVKALFDLQSCIEDAISLTAVLAVQKQLEITYSIHHQVPRSIQADASHLQQILVNLLTNAIKATSVGHVRITVDAVPTSSDAYELHFAVYDTGIGIPLDRFDDLFKPFGQINGDLVRSSRSTGLGLIISKKLSELMGGRIWVESTVGVGSIFHFVISATGSLLANQQPLTQFAGRRLLLVADHSFTRQALMRQAQAWGMLIAETTLLEEALDWISQGQQFDVAIIDVLNTDTDERALLNQAGCSQLAYSLPVLLIMPFETHEDPYIRDKQIQAVFHKPLRLLQVERALCDLFENQLQEVKPVDAQHTATLAIHTPLHILIVDDDTTNRALNQQYVQQLGHQVVAVQNGQQALDALECNPYEIVLLDIHMEPMNGMDVARSIRARWHEQQRPYLIALTGDALLDARTVYAAAGFDDYVRKPVRAAQLNQVLARFQAAHHNPVPAFEDVSTQRPLVAITDVHAAAEPDNILLAPMVLVSDSDEHLPPMLYRMYLEDAAMLLDTIGDAILSDDRVTIRRAAHKLKSSSALVAAEQLAHLCELLEHAPDATASTLIAQLRAMKAEFARVRQAIS